MKVLNDWKTIMGDIENTLQITGNRFLHREHFTQAEIPSINGCRKTA